jgi:hypothetical protein
VVPVYQKIEANILIFYEGLPVVTVWVLPCRPDGDLKSVELCWLFDCQNEQNKPNLKFETDIT